MMSVGAVLVTLTEHALQQPRLLRRLAELLDSLALTLRDPLPTADDHLPSEHRLSVRSDGIESLKEPEPLRERVVDRLVEQRQRHHRIMLGLAKPTSHALLPRLEQLLHPGYQVRRHERPAHESQIGVDPNRHGDRKSTRLNSSHVKISYAVFCLKKKM